MGAMTMTTDEAMTLAIRALIDCGSLSPAARDMRPADALHQWAEANAMTEDVDTFTCPCGDVEHPLTPGDDESIWCECGRRIALERAAAHHRAGLDRFSAQLGAALLPIRRSVGAL